jgi:glycosyltransferase involved in cell wall biosynthesis
MTFLTAIPVYNEERHLEGVLREVRRYSPRILVVDDGSTDRTAKLLSHWARNDNSRGRRESPDPVDLKVITHPQNRGYGAALISAFAYAIEQEIDVLVTMDCDGQHEPGRIPVLLEAIHDVDIVSGSRYLRDFRQDTSSPQDRRQINQQISTELNNRYGLGLTDAFCGFKAYRREALTRLRITESGWGMPLQLWVQAARLGLRIKEVGVPRIYLDPNRAFGGVLDNAVERLAYYRAVITAAEQNDLGVCSTGEEAKADYLFTPSGNDTSRCPRIPAPHPRETCW